MQLFVNVDAYGNIVTSYFGENIIATEPFDFFFLVEESVVESLADYRVVMAGFKATLDLK